jgi:hypothetical protein
MHRFQWLGVAVLSYLWLTLSCPGAHLLQADIPLHDNVAKQCPVLHLPEAQCILDLLLEQLQEILGLLDLGHMSISNLISQALGQFSIIQTRI